MFRRLVIALGLVALVATLFPTQPVSASNEGLAAAVITGIVDPTTDPCTITEKKPEHSLLGGKPATEVIFDNLVMTGAFGNYLGVVEAPAPIVACAENTSGLLPPLNQLAGWGRIGGGAFVGDNGVTGKCVRGALKLDAKGWAGDYIQVGVVAVVKFDLKYETGDLKAGECIVAKEDVEEINCVGAIAVAPVESVTGVDIVGDPVAGPIVCHPLLPSNKGDK